MNKGKFHRKAHSFNPRFVALLVSVVLVCSVAIGATLAYLIDDSGDPLTNVFNPSQVTSKVDETVSGNTKTNARIQNTGDVSAFIRAEVVVTWNDGNGNVLSEVPQPGTDYTLNLNTSTTNETGKWFEKDGYYYWPVEVAAGDFTGNLIASDNQNPGAVVENVDDKVRTKIDTDGNSYYVAIEIICSAIQADGVDANGNHPVELAWGVTYNDSTKTISAS